MLAEEHGFLTFNHLPIPLKCLNSSNLCSRSGISTLRLALVVPSRDGLVDLQVQPSTWHVATICVDLEKKQVPWPHNLPSTRSKHTFCHIMKLCSFCFVCFLQEMQVVLDGEQHLVAACSRFSAILSLWIGSCHPPEARDPSLFAPEGLFSSFPSTDLKTA